MERIKNEKILIKFFSIGDSGGPLIIKSRDCDDGQCYVLAGITSYVIGKKSGAFECRD